MFLPSGTLANQLAVRRLAKGRSRVIVQAESHLSNDSGDCVERLSGLNLVPLAPGRATFTREEVEAELARTASGRVATGVGVISIESPVRRLHGAMFDLGQMRAISALARERGIGLHLDGARLIVASAYTGIAPAEYSALFDTVYVSLWKSFSSGSGAILAGPGAELDDLYQDRRMFGGALHAAWPFAAVARHYADGVLERLRAGIVVSEALVSALAGSERLRVRARQGRHEPDPADGSRGAGRLPGSARGARRRSSGPGIGRKLLADGQRDLGADVRLRARGDDGGRARVRRLVYVSPAAMAGPF